ncbi:acyl-CoA carboxylase subunit epsilon [Streptomyces lasiicapitis]|uniref:Acyl-CoA carboxylase subunit epsilon n=1 Tax=Streptomyces lasiicapitis TaxID=1923961 RepID=A0ABQ2MYC3_9ACTN|nr:acyl-CoA carboxylase subunit epsilon [Streptomyces lasiicapitis]GGO60252.1 hypothetical protein GCM10012286_83700 [Streptomyces lasiicapitis]
MHSAQGEPALLRIERGQVTEEELAALTVALTALLAAGRDPAGPREGPGAGARHGGAGGPGGYGGGEQGCGCWPAPAGSGAYRAPVSWRCPPGGEGR